MDWCVCVSTFYCVTVGGVIVWWTGMGCCETGMGFASLLLLGYNMGGAEDGSPKVQSRRR